MGQCWSSDGLEEPSESISVTAEMTDKYVVSSVLQWPLGSTDNTSCQNSTSPWISLGFQYFDPSGFDLGHNRWSSWEKKIKNKIQTMQTSDLFLVWRVLIKRTWFSLKKKVSFCTFGVSLSYQCCGFGSTSQLPCGTYHFVTLDWIRAYGTEKCSPASFSVASMQGKPWVCS